MRSKNTSDSAGSSVLCPEGVVRGAAVNLNKVGSMPRRGAWDVPRQNFSVSVK